MRRAMTGLGNHRLRKSLRRFVEKGYGRVMLMLRPKYVRSLYGPMLRTNPSDVTFKFCIDATYGYYLADFLKSYTSPFVFIDVGANQGLYSLIAASNPNCCNVWAFEPVKATYKLLRRNARINHRLARIKTVNAAITAEAGQKRIFVNESHSGTASLHHDCPQGVTETINVVNSVALDATITPPESVDIIVKVDTEGHEPLVLQELRACNFWRNVRVLYFEIDDRWFDGKSLIDVFVKDDFSVVFRSEDPQHYDVMMTR